MALAVVASYFNPAGFQSHRWRYDKFRAGIEAAGVPLYTIELAFGDVAFALPSGPQTVQRRTRDVLWHKERLLNLLIRQLPAQVDTVAWIDADLLFTSPDWPEQVEQVLREFPIAQVFQESIKLPKGAEAYSGAGMVRIGVAHAVAGRLPEHQHMGKYAPGYAWAARRELLEKHGLYDAAIVGGADGQMVIACYDWKYHPYLAHFTKPMLHHYWKWWRGFWNDVRGRVGCVPGTVLHLWHGATTDRQYVERLACLTRHDFDPAVDLAPGADGCWHWATDKPTMHRGVNDYFASRREDG